MSATREIPVVPRLHRARPSLRPPPASALRLAAWLLFVVFVASIGARAQTAPRLVSVSPEDGATLVPTTSSLVFVFDQDMDTSVPLFQSIPNAIAGNFEVLATGFNQSLLASWGADKRSITIKPAIQFPYATFTWRLNPTGSIFPLKSKTGVALATVSGTFATGVGGTVPVLVSSSPDRDAINVALDIVVSFNFDQAMKTNTAIAGNPPTVPAAVAWTGAGLDVTKFRYSWSANGRSLLCDYVGDLPPNTDITWALNPANAAVKLENPAGKVVPSGTYAGTFRTGSGIPCNTTQPPPDQGNYSVFKSSSHLQKSAADPVPFSTNGAFRFGAIVQGSALGPAPTAASLTYPGGARKDLASVAGLYLQFIDSFDTEAALATAAPPGEYSLRLKPAGQAEVPVALTLPAANPPVPRIANFDAGQAIRADADFTLSWDAFTGAGPRDGISITLIDEKGRIRFSAPDPCVPRELAATDTSVVIPARSFATNSLLTGTIVFTRNFYFSTNAVPKFAGYGNIIRSTQFSLATVGGSGGGGPTAEPARLSNPSLLPNGNPRFELTGTPGASYTIQRSGAVGAAAAWSNLFAVTLDGAGHGVAEDTQAGHPFPAYYRAVAP